MVRPGAGRAGRRPATRLALRRRAGGYVWMSAVLEAVPDALRLLDTHDLFGDRHLAAHALGVDPSWFFTTVAEEARASTAPTSCWRSRRRRRRCCAPAR
ncbi:hypothetical protein ACFQU2_05880 [Siccirubricoccus deserti]